MLALGFIAIFTANYRFANKTNNCVCCSDRELGCFIRFRAFDSPVRVLIRNVYYSNATATTLYDLLKLSGNIELNSGPIRNARNRI